MLFGLLEKCQPGNVASAFYDYFQANKDDDGLIRWIDIEGELLKYVRNKTGSVIDEDLAREDERGFNMLKMMLQQYISRMPSIEPKSPDRVD